MISRCNVTTASVSLHLRAEAQHTDTDRQPCVGGGAGGKYGTVAARKCYAMTPNQAEKAGRSDNGDGISNAS